MFTEMLPSGASGGGIKEILVRVKEGVITQTGASYTTQTLSFQNDIGYLLFMPNSNISNRPSMIAYRDGNTIKMIARDYPQGSELGSLLVLKCEYISDKSCSFTNPNYSQQYTVYNYYE